MFLIKLHGIPRTRRIFIKSELALEDICDRMK